MSNLYFHLLKSSDTFQKLKFRDSYIARVDGSCCTDAESLFDNIAAAFEFPDYFGKNLDALYDCLVDLEWIPQDKIILFFYHTENLLAGETNDPDFLEDLMSTLYDVCISWDLGQDELISPKKFEVYMVLSPALRQVLDSNEIEYQIL